MSEADRLANGRIWVKVCGMTRAADVRAAVRAGADAVGLIFAPESPRRVSLDQAAALAQAARQQAAALGREVQVVGVFTQQEVPFILEAACAAGLDVVQLHGAQPEPVRRRIEVAGLRCIRALWPQEGAEAPAWEEPAPWAFLLDAQTNGRRGGTGTAPQAGPAAAWARRLGAHAPVILAGGLRPDNVGERLQAIPARGVDASSGVEVPGAPGLKDPGAMQAFVQAVRRWEADHGRNHPDSDAGRSPSFLAEHWGERGSPQAWGGRISSPAAARRLSR